MTVEPFERTIESNPFGGFDEATHNVVIVVDEALYKRIKRCQAILQDLEQEGFNTYSLSFWYGFMVYEQDWGVEGDDPDNGAEVDTECDELRVFTTEYEFTYYRDGWENVSWCTERLSIKELDQHFAKKESA